MRYDNFSHSSGKLRCWITCDKHGGANAKCQRWRFVHTFETAKHCEAWLLAWYALGDTWEGFGGMVEHMEAEPDDIAVEDMFLEHFHGKG